MWGFWDSIRSLTEQFPRAAQGTIFILTVVAIQQHTAVHTQTRLIHVSDDIKVEKNPLGVREYAFPPFAGTAKVRKERSGAALRCLCLLSLAQHALQRGVSGWDIAACRVNRALPAKAAPCCSVCANWAQVIFSRIWCLVTPYYWLRLYLMPLNFCGS